MTMPAPVNYSALSLNALQNLAQTDPNAQDYLNSMSGDNGTLGGAMGQYAYTGGTTGAAPVLTSQMAQAINPGGGADQGAGSGVGSNALSMLVPLMQQGFLTGNSGQALSGNDPMANWLNMQGLIGQNDQGQIGAGSQTPTALGPQGFGSGMTVQMAGNNPYGVNTVGGLNVHELQSPTQNPSAFGSNQYGPTTQASNLVHNHDIWDTALPIVQSALMAAFSGGIGALGGMGIGAGAGLSSGAGLGSLGNSLFNTLGGAIQSGQAPGIGQLGGVTLGQLARFTGGG